MRQLILSFVLGIAPLSFAQMPVFSISGTVVDSISGAPLEYATFILHAANDSSQITGIAAGPNGNFKLDSLRPGQFFARVSFLGYRLKTLTDLSLNREQRDLRLGAIQLAPMSLESAEVTIEAERMAVEYHVEKKVINVAQQNLSPIGTAADVLANAPSVSVDIEGNVKLRGSSNFTVMIDGRPSILDANDALQQIPAGTIDKIEIITNPSSRFSAEGTAGIINVIPLRRQSADVSGLINARSTTDERRGVDFSLVRPVGKAALTIGGDIGINRDPGDSRSETRTTFQDVTTTVHSNGSSVRNRDSGGLRAELDVPLGLRDNIVFGGRWGQRSYGRLSDLQHQQSDDLTPATTFLTSHNESERDFNFVSGFANWKHKYPEDDHSWTMDFSFGRRSGDEYTLNDSFDENGTLINGLKSTEDGPGMRMELKADYVRPMGKNRKLESGVSANSGDSEDIYAQYQYDFQTGTYVEQSEFRNSTRFRRLLPAAYTMYSDVRGKLEYQIGLRSEYLYRKIERLGTTEEFKIDRLDLYPSAHTAYELGGSKQAALSYTRRVEHARPWVLEPFITWEDAYSVRSGNPDLKPEFIDSYELGYQTIVFGQYSGIETFYRVKHNNIEYLRSVYAENVTLRRPVNVGRQFSLGVELRTDIVVRKGWTTGISGSLYDQRVAGEADGVTFDDHNFSYDAKVNNITALGKSTKLQLDAQYNGPELTSQGTSEPTVTVNAGLRQEFLEKRLNVALQVRDIFASSKRESTSEAPGLYSYDYFSMDAPVITLSIGYSFNNFKKNRDAVRGNVNGDDF